MTAARLMRPADIGRALGLARQTVNTMATTGELPEPVAGSCVNCGRRGRLWDADEVRAWADLHGRTWKEPEGDPPA